MENFDFEFWASVLSSTSTVLMFWYLLMGIFVSSERIHVHRIIVPIMAIMLIAMKAVFNTKLEKGITEQIVLISLWVLILLLNIFKAKTRKKVDTEKTHNHH